MKLDQQIQASYQSLREQAFQSRVLLLHPRSKYRSIQVAMLVNDPEMPTYYYALGPDDTSLQAFILGVANDLSEQNPKFGRPLNMLSATVFDNVKEQLPTIVNAFVASLVELGTDPVLLVFDEYDRSDAADDIHTFVEHLVDELPGNCHIILNSRSLPRMSWVAMIAKKQASILLDESLLEEDVYGMRKEGDFDLQVHALGPSYVLYKNERIESWEGHLPRLLFFFALDKPTVTRSEICRAFWPDLATDQAVNVFHVTKRRLHKALGADVLEHNDNQYMISPDMNVYYDVMDFVEALVRGRDPNNPDAFEAWQKAVKLYQGPFLQGHNDTWIDEKRTAFRAGYLEAMTAMAQEWVKKDRKEIALKLYREALDEDFQHEELHRQVMTLYNDLGRRSEAVAHYREMQKVFESAGIDISDSTTDIYQSIAE